MLKDKKIILGISGSIAAYKSAVLVRLLKKKGADVQVIMTPSATQFIPALTLSTLSGHPVFIQSAENDQWNNHVDLAKKADIFLLAPASANTLAKMRTGICDNLLLTTYLSCLCPVFIAPAMDLDMWHHPATQENIKALLNRGIHLLEVGEGELASGLVGEGRMSEPEEIVRALELFCTEDPLLKGKKILVTAGPTYEPIDPVRFIGNHSSGKMGIALAEAFAELGATVNLVLGPVNIQPKNQNIQIHEVTTTQEMKTVCEDLFPISDISILAAAVSDYRPAKVATQKIKKSEQSLSLPLEKNPDILQILGRQKKPNQTLAGFALETENEETHALEKLKKKNLDMIVLNSLSDPGAGFKVNTNKVTLYDRTKRKIEIPLLSKKEVARSIVKQLIPLHEKRD